MFIFIELLHTFAEYILFSLLFVSSCAPAYDKLLQTYNLFKDEEKLNAIPRKFMVELMFD